MIITRSPLRISLGGGGTDLPSYYEVHGGYVISMGISKYIYTIAQRQFNSGILLRYSKIENCQSIDDIQHPIIKAVLRHLLIDVSNFEITTLADVPAGTGLGSSGSFTTALLKALYAYKKIHISAQELAELSCYIEIDVLGEPVGKQDQYIAAYGGVTEFDFHQNGSVTAKSLTVSDETLSSLCRNVLMFYTGKSRKASSLLIDQKIRTHASDHDMIDNLHTTKKLGVETRKALLRGDLCKWAEILREHWEMKRKRTVGMSNELIDEYYEHAINHGALGGKLVGAGGGGFLLFYTEDTSRLRRAMERIGLSELHFNLDFEGTKVIS